MDDPLLEVLRSGARQMLQQVIEAEVEAFLAAHADLEDSRGRRRVVRNGHAPEREIQTGIGPIEVRRPKVRDRGDGAGGERIRFTSKVLPPFLRRTKNVEELLPWLYLEGVSTGQFEEALAALLGPDAPGLSAATVRRLVAGWQQEHQRWQSRDLSTRRYVYIWADGVYFTPRLDHDRQCILVLIGADADGRKELLAIEDGYRESTRPPHAASHVGAPGELARAAAPAARRERPRHGARARHRRWRARLLEGASRSLVDDPPAEMLGPQDRQRPGRPAEVGARQGQEGPPRDRRGGDPRLIHARARLAGGFAAPPTASRRSRPRPLPHAGGGVPIPC
jgi:hypothetical protein